MIDLIPAPVIGYGRDRTKTARWTGDTDADGKTLVFELSVSHDRDRKLFRAYVTRLLESNQRGFNVSEYQPFRDIVRLSSIPVARYSDKALEAAFTVKLADLANIADADEIVALRQRAD